MLTVDSIGLSASRSPPYAEQAGNDCGRVPSVPQRYSACGQSSFRSGQLPSGRVHSRATAGRSRSVPPHSREHLDWTRSKKSAGRCLKIGQLRTITHDSHTEEEVAWFSESSRVWRHVRSPTSPPGHRAPRRAADSLAPLPERGSRPPPPCPRE